MELLLMGVGVMALGEILVHLAIQGAKSEQIPVEVLVPTPLPPAKARQSSTPKQMPSPIHVDFSKSDVLLADTLTELLTVREQVSSLQAKVDALSAELRPTVVASNPSRPVRRRMARGVA